MQRKVLGTDNKRRMSIMSQRQTNEHDQLRTYYRLDEETSKSVLARTGLEYQFNGQKKLGDGTD
jgi:hypothetical protein